jgi:hypothetical protein
MFTAPDLETLPRRPTRATAARLITQHFFETTPRSLEDWGLQWLIIGGRATCDIEDLFAAAQARLDAARPSRRASGPARAKAQRTVDAEAA